MSYQEKKKRIKDLDLLATYRSMRCCLSETLDCYGPVAGHHIMTRGAGGDDVEDNLIPLCESHHTRRGDSIHQIGPRPFLEMHKCFLGGLAEFKLTKFLERRGL